MHIETSTYHPIKPASAAVEFAAGGGAWVTKTWGWGAGGGGYPW
jgi:hypothetical protein